MEKSVLHHLTIPFKIRWEHSGKNMFSFFFLCSSHGEARSAPFLQGLLRIAFWRASIPISQEFDPEKCAYVLLKICLERTRQCEENGSFATANLPRVVLFRTKWSWLVLSAGPFFGRKIWSMVGLNLLNSLLHRAPAWFCPIRRCPYNGF